MRSSLILCAIFTLIVKQNATITKKLKADCKINICSCKNIQDQLGAIEFRVVCIGNGTQEIVLDDEIFKNETKPDWSRKIYVRMTNFSSLTVDNSFISSWQAYTSCSFDIWSCQKSVFSSVAPPIAQHSAEYHAFAGIGVIDSDINAFPPMLFREKNEVRLKLVRSHLTHLDVVSLGAMKVNYLTINDSIIGKIGGTQKEQITLAYSYKYHDAEVVIQNSKIGIIAKGGLAFNDYDKKKAKVVLTNSNVGLLEEGSIIVGRKVSLSVTQSNIGYIPAIAFEIKESGQLTIKRSVLTVKKSALKNFTCNKDIQISNNILLPDDMFKNCSIDELNNYTNCEEIGDFIDNSCDNNRLWSSEEEKNEKISTTPTSVTIPTSTTVTTIELHTTNNLEIVNTTEEIMLDADLPKAQQQLRHNRVPMGLFYLTIGLCLVLFVMVMVLTAMVAWGKTSKKTNKPKDGKNSGCYDDYDGPSVAYFVPNAPLPLSMRRNSEDDTNNDLHYYEN